MNTTTRGQSDRRVSPGRPFYVAALLAATRRYFATPLANRRVDWAVDRLACPG
jgi:hypothetical protein